MKNKMVRGLVMTGMACMLLTACGSKKEADVTQPADTVVTVETTDTTVATEADTVVEPSTEMKEESTPKSETVTLTSADFVVNILDDGTAMLTQYSGDAESVIIPSEVDGMTVTVIGKDAFVNHEELKSISIPDTVVEISEQAFFNCWNLENVVMSKNVEKIGKYAFSGLYEVDLPNSLRELGYGAFSDCKFTSIVIPAELAIIPEYAFGSTMLTEVVIPSNIQIIDKSAFKYCSQLKTVEIKEGVEVIEEDAFAKCDILESITIPASVTEMTDPFYDSPNVTIYTPAGSYAETWAAENGVPCVTQ